MECQYKVLVQDGDRECGVKSAVSVYGVHLCPSHLTAVNKDNWLRPDEVKVQP